MKSHPKLLTLATIFALLIGPVMPGTSSLPGFSNDALALTNNDKTAGSKDTADKDSVKDQNDGQDKVKENTGDKDSASGKKDSPDKGKKDTDDDDFIESLDGET